MCICLGNYCYLAICVILVCCCWGLAACVGLVDGGFVAGGLVTGGLAQAIANEELSNAEHLQALKTEVSLLKAEVVLLQQANKDLDAATLQTQAAISRMVSKVSPPIHQP